MQLREAVFTARTRLKQAELEAEQWKEELRRLQAHSQEQGQQILTLRQERQAGQEKTNRSVLSDAKGNRCAYADMLLLYYDVSASPGCSMRCRCCSNSCVKAGSSSTLCRVNSTFMIEFVPAQEPTKVSPSSVCTPFFYVFIMKKKTLKHIEFY